MISSVTTVHVDTPGGQIDALLSAAGFDGPWPAGPGESRQQQVLLAVEPS